MKYGHHRHEVESGAIVVRDRAWMTRTIGNVDAAACDAVALSCSIPVISGSSWARCAKRPPVPQPMSSALRPPARRTRRP
ncbi:hypothetical protein ABIB25_005173 [Nakamurella sp. UYEF19]